MGKITASGLQEVNHARGFISEADFKGTELCFGITAVSVLLGEDKGKDRSEVHMSVQATVDLKYLFLLKFSASYILCKHNVNCMIQLFLILETVKRHQSL